ncbi:MAG: polysaccharide biosynthesis protein, partial [Phycisphaeraceae bacterium]|nr:polysaccharide biosynthesis protein [Phycisphaeraceae bacterium]
GAGQAGVGLASMLAEDNSVAIECFIDDDRRLTGRDVRGVEVFHPDQLDELVERRSVDTVMLALPSASRQRRREVIDILRGRGIEILTVPDLQELDSGQAKFTDLRPIDIQDLLGRESVTPQQPLLVAKIRGRVVMVTGAGGSIGTELCRQIIELGPARLILIDNCEFNLFRIDAKLAESNPLGVAVVPILGTVCDGLLMQETMERYDVQTVYHAAAYKHVPIVERNPVVGVQNNVIGTLRLAEAAVRSGVQDFVAISTDKAVRPTGVMGASKRLAELILQGLQNQSSERAKTRFCMARFANVLGSSGSAVPKFSEQIRTGGPLTVTHPEVTRYFMTVHDAANLVIQAGALTKGGDVFVLDMGEPVKILDLATRMIDLAGVSVRSDAMHRGQTEIVFTGLQ